jgi:hypothetical protein
MSAMAEAARAALPVEPASLTAFDAAMMQAPSSSNAKPDALGRALLEGLDHFNAHATQFQTTVQQAAGLTPADAASTAIAVPTDAIAAKPGISASTAIEQGAALQQKSLGLMMQTYSFALEATLVSNAATTFTSSINTLIKTQ